jgi:hypothetical protein
MYKKYDAKLLLLTNTNIHVTFASMRVVIMKNAV